VASTYTSNGSFAFDTIANGAYRIRVILPSGYEFSPQAGNDGGDSDVDSSGYSGYVTISGASSYTVNAGLKSA